MCDLENEIHFSWTVNSIFEDNDIVFLLSKTSAEKADPKCFEHTSKRRRSLFDFQYRERKSELSIKVLWGSVDLEIRKILF